MQNEGRIAPDLSVRCEKKVGNEGSSAWTLAWAMAVCEINQSINQSINRWQLLKRGVCEIVYGVLRCSWILVVRSSTFGIAREEDSLWDSDIEIEHRAEHRR